jgi:putative membrane protein
VLATKLVNGIHCDDGATLVAVVLLLTFFNAILKPLLVVFTLPFIVLTMGLGIIVINALLFLFVGRLVDGFYVDGFWSAVGGALIVSITNIAFSGILGKKSSRKDPPPSRPTKRKGDDVIDI